MLARYQRFITSNPTMKTFLSYSNVSSDESSDESTDDTPTAFFKEKGNQNSRAVKGGPSLEALRLESLNFEALRLGTSRKDKRKRKKEFSNEIRTYKKKFQLSEEQKNQSSDAKLESSSLAEEIMEISSDED